MEQPKYAKLLDNKSYLERNFDLLSTYSTEAYYPGSRVPNMPISYIPLNIISPKAVSASNSLYVCSHFLSYSFCNIPDLSKKKMDIKLV